MGSNLLNDTHHEGGGGGERYDNYPLELDEEEMNSFNMNSSHRPFGDLTGPHSFIYMDKPEEMLLPWKSNPNFVPIVLTHVITFVIGLVGNIVVISAMSRKHGDRSVTSMFLVSLAVADLLLVAVCAPLETMGYFLNTWTQGGRLCRLQSYVEMLSAVASVLNLTAVTLERYLVIVYPMKSRSFCTLHNCRRALIAVWIFALLLTAPVLVTKDAVTYVYYNNDTSVAVHYCMDTMDIDQSDGGSTWASYSGFFIALYQLSIMLILPLLLMIVCYSRVIKELWLSTKQITMMTRDGSNSPQQLNQHQRSAGWTSRSPSLSTISGRVNRSRHSVNKSLGKSSNYANHQRSGDGAKQARKQVIKMLILVVLLFLFCWGPRLLLNTLIKWGLSSYDTIVYQLRIAFNLLPFIHSCLNPFIYGFMSTNFRRMIMRSFRKRRCRTTCFSCCGPEEDTTNSIRPHSAVFEMSRRNHLNSTTEATHMGVRSSFLVNQERPHVTFTTEEL